MINYDRDQVVKKAFWTNFLVFFSFNSFEPILLFWSSSCENAESTIYLDSQSTSDAGI